MIPFNLKQLEAFVAAAEWNSFTRAAEELYLTQSTVSAHIAGLEQALGVLLFQREAKKKICLTPEGKAIYLRAREILSRCGELKNPDDAQENQLSIGASTVPAQYLLPALMSEFLPKHPGCQYLLKRGDTAQIHGYLAVEAVHLGFVGAAADPKTYRYHTLLEDELVLCTAATDRYRALWNGMTRGSELLGEPMILREETSGTLRALRGYLRRIGRSQESLHVVARSDSPEAIKNMVAEGLGVSVLSALAVRQEVSEGKLLSFPMDSEGVFRKLYLAYRREEQLSRLEREFVAFVRAGAKKAVIE
ncbi:MAG: selenium metabolism-associated LysR family transcriptional regulator [Oscillospiraceae bacterium]